MHPGSIDVRVRLFWMIWTLFSKPKFTKKWWSGVQFMWNHTKTRKLTTVPETKLKAQKAKSKSEVSNNYGFCRLLLRRHYQATGVNSCCFDDANVVWTQIILFITIQQGRGEQSNSGLDLTFEVVHYTNNPSHFCPPKLTCCFVNVPECPEYDIVIGSGLVYSS